MANKRVLFVGESWHVHTTEAKGFDVFTYDHYEEATEYIQAALEKNGIEFIHIPSHLVEQRFPETLNELQKFDVVMFSDVGANTMNLPMNAFINLKPCPSKLKLVRQYVEAGGAFCMIGGYLSFQGIQARGAYKNTPIEEILPVLLDIGDDRREESEGLRPIVCRHDHAAVCGLEGEWPQVLGYNHLTAKPASEVVVKIGSDPLLVFGSYGKGRTCAYATDCAPHWSPVEFCTWPGYAVLWGNIVSYLCGA